MSHDYFNPVRSVYGEGALLSLPTLVGPRRAVLVTFPEAAALGLVARVRALLGDRLAGVIDDVRPNPDVAELRGQYERFWRDNGHGAPGDGADVIVAMGGGSAIDTAKALMVGTASGRFDELLGLLQRGEPFKPHAVKALIAVPTTAGTGSEVTPWATIWDRGQQRKHSLHLPSTWPEIALVDPLLMMSLPPSVTLQSGLDALSHALEAIWNRNANPLSDTYAVSAAQDIVETLPSLMRRPHDRELRARMALAALKAGMAFSNTRTALAHSISYEMTLRLGLPHGIACSFPLPTVLQLALGRSPERDAVLARALGHPLADAPGRLATFLEGLGVPTRFASYGLGDAETRELIARALTGARGRNFIGADADTTEEIA
jgi:phosphonate metabolism-associated iron-containing alcohol dehydrogenase